MVPSDPHSAAHGRGAAPDFEDRFVDVPGGRVFVRVWDGPIPARARPPLILFHDSLGSVALWRDFPADLAAAPGHPVVAYDRLGFGRSEPSPGPLDDDFIHTEARTVVPALRADLGIERSIPFGHSVGGAMAVASALAMPDACVAVVTEGAIALVDERTVAGLHAAKAAFAAPGQLERLARYHGDKAAWVFSAWVDTWLSPRYAHWRLDADVRQLRCPVLALHGARDDFGSPEHLDAIAAAAPAQSECYLLEDCGHVPHREQPGAVLRHVKAFLGRHCQAQDRP
jgi:pimeloyl-ACP methyl ester carboxylesterase